MGAELAESFSEWASREGILTQITEEQCADLAKAYIAGAVSAAVAAAPHIAAGWLVLVWRDERGGEICRTPPLMAGTARIAIPIDAQHVDLLTGETS
jgi:hypothetical protein